jgi:hypothetical protein
MRAGGGKVSTILLDERHLAHYNKKRYLVYINIDDSQVLWKAIDDMSCIVEFDLNF